MADEFRIEVMAASNLAHEWGDMQAVLADVANGVRVPPSRYKKLSVGKKLKYSVFEAKSRHLRLYLFEEKGTGLIMIMGGKKTEQKEDIKVVKKIVKEYALFKQQT